ncbi:MAG TPA: undecaprenyl-phosphate glucose phosphotransferase [Steroidobacteraceae bacterium]|nr:undecaprenyl-phosphate glucose phosphotransferase [Steroidobacteraceae bacterium]
MPQARVIDDGPLAAAIEGPAGRIHSFNKISALSGAAVDQKTVRLGTLEPPLLALLKHWSKPAVVAGALLLCMLFSPERATRAYWALALVAVLISRQVFSPLQMLSATAKNRAQRKLLVLMLQWGVVVAILLLLGLALRLGTTFPNSLLLNWFAVTSIALLVGDICSGHVASRTGAARQRYIIIGANTMGVELERRVSQSVGMGTFMGFFDFRSVDRLPRDTHGQFAGQCKDVAAFVRLHAVNAIYIALPMSNAPRIEEMLQEFRDTTASIYFVPDIFAFDLVQARCVEINGIAMLSICDTPFHGMNAVQKRVADIMLSSLALLVCWPAMLMAAIAVKLSSPGPALFKQRRYGLHGEEIVVYKFRSMTVCEDGSVVVQAKREDERITAVGRFLRRTSLDELPQLFNVLEGRMSFVGPRPHAVAHNEEYRKLISGYMIRHKVRPGMTGWAQVHGLRGETTTVEQMRLRVEYDLYYLRQWSLWLDLWILAKTAVIVIRGRNAF